MTIGQKGDLGVFNEMKNLKDDFGKKYELN